MSHSPQVLFIFPYIGTVIEWLALSAAPVLLLLCALDWRMARRQPAALRSDTQSAEAEIS